MSGVRRRRSVSSGARHQAATSPPCRFFGRGGFGFGGGEEDEEEQTPKGHDVIVELEATLRDLYLGASFQVGIAAADYHHRDSSSAGCCLG
jgi:DnaJ-class molecular chaperone